ncbi:MAG: 50S ribosomal protein L21e [Candidatus Aenigmarchaeota archaeon]|nr:50S ribosomal protein L21e [Candidatus Aenigmarchaeota archaeon]MDW8149212.1 50S ribosomal protein L21e [Candidatus Aenigmarchaeota archaeon]
MVKKSKGFRSRTRKAFKIKEKKGITIYLQDFKIGEKVSIVPYSQSQNAIPHKLYRGKIGEIVGKRGKAYIVRIGNKTIFSYPEHLRKVT